MTCGRGRGGEERQKEEYIERGRGKGERGRRRAEKGEGRIGEGEKKAEKGEGRGTRREGGLYLTKHDDIDSIQVPFEHLVQSGLVS